MRSVQSTIRAAVVLAAALALVAASGKGAAAQTAQACLSTQLQVSGAVCHGISRCYRKAMKKSLPLDPACLTEQTTKIASKFVSPESLAVCLTEPAAASVDAMLQPEVADWANGLGLNGQKCASIKMGALGRSCKQQLRCYATASANSDVVDPACLDEAADRAQLYFSRQDLEGACLATSDYPGYETQVGQLASDVHDLLRGVGTTTTTTTTTTTSSSTTTLPPGSCAENGAMDPCVAYRDNAACTACVDAAMDPVAATLCTGAGPLCGDAINNIACGYAINTATTCGVTCCP